MTVRTSQFPLQRLIRALPRPLQRIKIAQLFAKILGTPYHSIAFQQGELIGNIKDHGVAHSLVRGSFADHGYFDLARCLLREGDVHVDLGANYGFHTFGLLQSFVGHGVKHVLIDANPDCAACLSESAKLHPTSHLRVFHAAAAVEEGEISFSFAESETTGGRVGSSGASEEVIIRVPAKPLDNLFEENGIDHIRLLKMDIEGSEPFAMQSLSRMLSSHAVDFVYFEVNPDCLKLQKANPASLFSEFTRHGYRLFWPHDGVDWILRTYGGDEAIVSELKRFTVSGNAPYEVIELDESRVKEGQFGQCDLLAISPRCRVEARSSRD
jgi:FkbM family methyltransferase